MSVPRSSGRGGAGNISAPAGSAAPLQTSATDLTTPTIKAATYTTGRGGSGNMATNDPSKPQVARAAQDVEAPAAHSKEPRGTFHWGRGGEGNMVTVRGGSSNSNGNGSNNNPNPGGVEAKGGDARMEGVQAQAQQTAQPQRRTEGRETLGAALNPKIQRRGSLQEALEKGKEMFRLKKEDKKRVPEDAVDE